MPHDFMLRHSELHDITCRSCAKLCDDAGDKELAALSRRCAALRRKPHGTPA